MSTSMLARLGRPQIAFLATGLVMLADARELHAHVKWFAPYSVAQTPQPIAATLANPYFWSGLALALGFFLSARMLEKTGFGAAITYVLDRVTEPVWRHHDHLMAAVIGAFLVAIFTMGGVYLTPDLKTGSELVSWMQLGLAATMLGRRTWWIGGLGILMLWVLALAQYPLFHLIDYLALGLGIALFLIVSAGGGERASTLGLAALRWGLALSLMWSSLEKFAYPGWFDPLVDAKPFLTFGLPREVFVPMAGVAEFTLGFGLVSTPLVRRLSALALLVVFNAAVYPFGRLDLVGHALLIAMMVSVAADRTPAAVRAARPVGRLAAVPGGLAVALVIFSLGYWGLHGLFYGQTYEPHPTETRQSAMAG